VRCQGRHLIDATTQRRAPSYVVSRNMSRDRSLSFIVTETTFKVTETTFKANEFR